MAISEFEKSAQKAAVEAVEQRWKHDNDLKRRLRWRSRIGSFCSIVVLLAGLVGMGVFAERHFGFRIPYLSDCEAWQSLCSKVESAERFVGWETSARKKSVMSYDEALTSFCGKACTSWSQAPAEIGLKAAPAGTQYLFLCGYGLGDVRLYQVTAKGQGETDVVQLVRSGPPLLLEAAAFRAAVKGKTTFVFCRGNVYFFGKKMAAVAKIELDRLLDKNARR